MMTEIRSAVASARSVEIDTERSWRNFLGRQKWSRGGRGVGYTNANTIKIHQIVHLKSVPLSVLKFIY